MNTTTIRKLKEYGVEVYFEEQNIYTMDGNGELLLTIMSSIAQEKSRNISENVTWGGVRKRFADGKVSMPYAQFMGDRRSKGGTMEIVKVEAKIIKTIFRRFLEGAMPAMIVRELNHAGIPCPSRKSLLSENEIEAAKARKKMARWSASTIESILSNEKYKGDAILQKTYCTDYLRKTFVKNDGSEIPRYYVWVDGGATEHYFPISGSQPYKDSEGMELKLTASGSTLTITDKSHNAMTFPLPSDTAWQNLTKIADALGNTATLTYDDDGRLTQITDGAGRVTAFTYNAGGLLSSLSIPGCPVLSYTYTGENLTGIFYADVNSSGTTFTYEGEASNLLTGAQNYDGLKLNIGFEGASSYDSAAVDDYAQQVRRVISLEQAGGSLAGVKQLFEYLHMTTRVTAVSNTSDDTGKTLTYLFNQNGNVVCTYDELGYAASGTYSDSNANQQTGASRLHKAVVNLLKNIDFSAGWAEPSESSGGTAARDEETCCLNMPSLKISNTVYTQSVIIPTAGNYTFSAYVKNDTDLSGDPSKGLFVRICSGAEYESCIVNRPTAAHNTDSAADGWERVYVSAYLPAGETTIELVSTTSSDSTWFACPQLEEGVIANHANLLLNGDFS